MRAQVTPEALVVITAAFGLLLIFTVIYFGENTNVVHAQKTITAREIAFHLAGGIDKVYSSGDGASLKMSLRASDDYNITVSGRSVYVASGNVLISAPLLTDRVSAPSQIPSEVFIKNENNIIVIA
ncbi:MAG: hypothetical protein AB1468_05485 [Candidatus Micrarchaeota archaeon]